MGYLLSMWIELEGDLGSGSLGGCLRLLFLDRLTVTGDVGVRFGLLILLAVQALIDAASHPTDSRHLVRDVDCGQRREDRVSIHRSLESPQLVHHIRERRFSLERGHLEAKHLELHRVVECLRHAARMTTECLEAHVLKMEENLMDAIEQLMRYRRAVK